MSSLLEARDLSKTYVFGDRPLSILAGLSLVVEESEMVSIVGASGVGKSTVVRAALNGVAGRLDIVLSVSVTTRAPRGGETDGVDYRFLT